MIKMIVFRNNLKNTNQFVSLYERSIVKFHMFSSEVMGILDAYSANPEIMTIYNETKPIFDTFNAAYSNVGSSKNLKMGDTKLQHQLLRKLSKEHLPKWEATVKLEFPEDSPEYKSIFPNGRKPYTRVPIDKRLVNLSSLINTLTTFPQFTTLNDEVKKTWEKIIKARDAKLSKEGSYKYSSTSLKDAAKAMAVQHYKNLGKIMTIYAAYPEMVDIFFPYKYFRTYTKQYDFDNDIYKLNVAAGKTAEAGFVFSVNQSILVSNNSISADIKLWFSQTKNGTATNTISVPAGDEIEINVSDYAGIDDRFLMVENTSNSEAAEVELTIF